MLLSWFIRQQLIVWIRSRRSSIWHLKSRHWYRWTGPIQAGAHHESTQLAVSSARIAHIRPSGQSLIPVVMSGIIAVYGLVVSVLIAGGRELRIVPARNDDISR